MEKIKAFVAKHKYPVIGVAIIVVAVMMIFGDKM